jgi:hypothetical protein
MSRNRRAGGLAAAIMAALLATTSACGTDTNEPDASAVPTETAPASTLPDVTIEPATPNAPDTTAVPDEPTVSEGVEVPSPFGTTAEDPDFVAVQWLVPWDDGFLALGVQYPPAGLPEQLPPEIADLFPPEVVELFPDGLPPTQQEAITILEDAGLLDAVMEVIDEHPEAFDALTSVPQSTPTLLGMWSADGEDWVSLDITPPEDLGVPTQLVVVDDRLTIVGSTPPFGVTPFPRRVAVATTTDLDAWMMDSFEIDLPAPVPESVEVYADAEAVAANDDGWVVRVMTDAFVADPAEFLPEEVAALLHEPGMGLGMDPEGITIEHFEDGAATSVERFTWDELDIAEELMPYVWGDTMTMTLWAAQWGGEPESMVRDDFSGEVLIATNAGFLALGQEASYSPDGVTWSALETPQPNLSVEAVAPLGDDVIAYTRNASDEVALYRVDPTGGTWTLLDLPAGVEGHAHTWTPASSPAFLVENWSDNPSPQRIVVQHEGFELTLTYGAVESYRLVDEATGDVVLEESIDLTVTQAPPDGPFQHLLDDMSGMTITDPDTGDVIVSIPHSVIGAAWQVAQGGAADQMWPDWSVLATADGETWLFADYDEGDGDDPAVPFLVASNGDYVLVGSPGWEPESETWYRFPMP